MIAYVLYVFYRNVNLLNIFHCDNAIQNFTVSYFSVICCNPCNKLCMATFLLLYSVATVQLILPAIHRLLLLWFLFHSLLHMSSFSRRFQSAIKGVIRVQSICKKKCKHFRTHFEQIFHVFSVQATLKGEEKRKPAVRRPATRRQTHTQGRFLVILTVHHIFLPYAK